MMRKFLGAGLMLGTALSASQARADVAPPEPDAVTLALPIVGLLILVGVIALVVKRRRKP